MKNNKTPYGSYAWWFKKLPMSARMKARRNTAKRMSLLEKPPLSASVGNTLCFAFNFDNTPEGFNYWHEIASKWTQRK